MGSRRRGHAHPRHDAPAGRQGLRADRAAGAAAAAGHALPCFQEGQRIVNRDGHVEVAKAYYSAPPEFLGRKVWIRWDSQVVRLFDPQFKQIAIHARREPGRFATDQRHIAPEKRGGLERGAVWWLRKAQAIGPEAGRWAETLLARAGFTPCAPSWGWSA
ncbi:MAG: hypothetical protein IPM64_00170 [Phycisphaerales bacterium]|nr:hypothetical protein [Phycisphaerales bacterium]